MVQNAYAAERRSEEQHKAAGIDQLRVRRSRPEPVVELVIAREPRSTFGSSGTSSELT